MGFWPYLWLSAEKAMAPHSSTLAWKLPWTEKPGRLWSMGSLRVRHDWATSLSLFTFMHWRRKWQPTPVFFPGQSQGWGSLVAAVYGVVQSQTQLKWLSSSIAIRYTPEPDAAHLANKYFILFEQSVTICVVCPAIRDIHAFGGTVYHLQVWCSSSMTSKHIWEIRILDTTHKLLVSYYTTWFVSLTSWLQCSGILGTTDSCYNNVHSMLSKQHLLYPPLEVSTCYISSGTVMSKMLAEFWVHNPGCYKWWSKCT